MSFDIETSEYFRNFDWGRLKAFYYVAKVGNISHAAHYLNVAQSSMSRNITHLEAHLGYPLFSRSKGGVKLTRKGEELLEIVENTFLGIKKFTSNIQSTVNYDKQRNIRIASTHAMAAYILNDLIFSYNQEHPHLTFEIIGEDRLIDIILNDVDIAIRPIDPRICDIPPEQGVLREYLFSLEKKLFASNEYLEKYGKPQTVEDIKNHHVIAHAQPDKHPYSDVNWILRLGMPEGELHKPSFTSNSIECLISMAKKGKGIIGSYEEMSILKDSKLKKILPDVKDKEIKQYFIYPEYYQHDKDILGIKEFLQTNLSKKPLK